MKLYLNILKSLLRRDNYQKYWGTFSTDFLQKNYPELYRLYLVLPRIMDSQSGSEEFSVDDLELAYFSAYPKADMALANVIFNALRETTADNFVVLNALEEMRKRELALKVAQTALKASEGLATLDDIQPYLEASTKAAEALNYGFTEQRLSVIVESRRKLPGLRWRLRSLNVALGSLRKGNFGFVFARPETGKTTFLASETTFMAEQLTADQGPIIWFNNEEECSVVQQRVYQAALGLTTQEMHDTILGSEKSYFEKTKGKLLIVDAKNLGKKEIEQYCEHYKPSLIIFDQIDKIQGFAADRNDLELKEIYIWARNLAGKYGPVIGVCQAGASGEGKKYLTMTDVDNSKTGKQGEADWILGIGATSDMGAEDIRFLHLSKNKLPGDEDSDSTMRHGKWAVLIQPEIARYKDVA